VPGAPCLPAAAAIDHFKSKEAGDVSGGSTGKKASRERYSVLLDCYQKMSWKVFQTLLLLNMEPFKALPQ